jgi:very-short-patch-repair endonuclease
MTQPNNDLSGFLADHDGVLSTSAVLRFMTVDQLRWKIGSGRWQKVGRGVVATQSGPLNERQMLRAVLLRAGPRSALAGLTAARLDGLKGFDDKAFFADRPIHLLMPYGYKRRTPPLGLTVVPHYSGRLDGTDVHPVRQPRRTRIARSLVDAASWMATDRGAMAVLAAGVEQRLARADDLRLVADRIGAFHRRKLIVETIGDIAGGSQSLSELDFIHQVVRAFQLPEPSRQAARRDARGRRRWIDAMWDQYKIVVEIDGAQHTEDALQRWDDMERDIDLGLAGYQTLRFPAWLVRNDPEYVARRILDALRRAGYQGWAPLRNSASPPPQVR